MPMITLRPPVSAEGLLHLTLPVRRFFTKEVKEVKEVGVTIIVNPLSKVKPFPITRLEDDVGCVGYKGPAKSGSDAMWVITINLRGHEDLGGLGETDDLPIFNSHPHCITTQNL